METTEIRSLKDQSAELDQLCSDLEIEICILKACVDKSYDAEDTAKELMSCSYVLQGIFNKSKKILNGLNQTLEENS